MTLIVDIEPILRPSPNLYEYWMFPVLLAIFIILAYVRLAYSKRLPRIFSSVFRIQIMRQMMREELVFSHRASVLLFVNFVLVISLILYSYADFQGWKLGIWQGQSLYWAIAGIVSSVYIIKLFGNYLLRKLFNDKGLLKEYMYEVFLLNKVLGLLFIPIVFGLIFLNTANLSVLFLVFLILMAITILYRLIQGSIMCSGYTVSAVYIILYLCTLEILPFAIVFKAIALQVTE